MRHYFLFFLLSIFLFSCQDEPKNIVDVSGVEVDFAVDRFDQLFYGFDGGNLKDLKEKYPLMFPANTHDSIWVGKMRDKDEKELFSETQKLYKDFSKIEVELTALFKHIKYYDTKFEAPDVITILSNIDYEYRVVYNDLLLLISLDVFLGKEHPFYGRLSNIY